MIVTLRTVKGKESEEKCKKTRARQLKKIGIRQACHREPSPKIKSVKCVENMLHEAWHFPGLTSAGESGLLSSLRAADQPYVFPYISECSA